MGTMHEKTKEIIKNKNKSSIYVYKHYKTKKKNRGKKESPGQWSHSLGPQNTKLKKQKHRKHQRAHVLFE